MIPKKKPYKSRGRNKKPCLRNCVQGLVIYTSICSYNGYVVRLQQQHDNVVTRTTYTPRDKGLQETYKVVISKDLFTWVP